MIDYKKSAENKLIEFKNTQKFLSIKENIDILYHATDFLDSIFENPSNSQRLWHVKNKFYEIKYCSGCEKNLAVWDAKHVVYSCCSKECKNLTIGKKASKSNKNKDVQQKKMKTMIANLGENPYSVIYEKLKKTNLIKYGNEHAMCSQIIKDKESTRKLKIFREQLLDKEYELIDKNYQKIKLKHKICQSIFEISLGTYSSRKFFKTTLCTKCCPLYKSSPEIELFDFIKSIVGDSIEIISHDRKTIKGYELDIHIPELKLAFEFNGLYWHSDLFLDKNYHRDKRRAAEKQGIRLIQIWEDLWCDKQPIIKSIISGVLKKNQVIFGRKCNIEQIGNVGIVKNFLDENHLQGKSQYSVAIGAYYNGELQQVMTFIKNKNGYELARLCNKCGVSVIGGASRLFKQFIKTYNPNHIITFCDLTMFTGSVYRELNMNQIKGEIKPTYFYVENSTRQRFHRRIFQRKSLIADNSTNTEKQIMFEKGFFRVYNAGNLKFIWNNI